MEESDLSGEVMGFSESGPDGEPILLRLTDACARLGVAVRLEAKAWSTDSPSFEVLVLSVSPFTYEYFCIGHFRIIGMR